MSDAPSVSPDVDASAVGRVGWRSGAVATASAAFAWAIGTWALAGPTAGLWALAGGLGTLVLLGSTPLALGPIASAMPSASLAVALMLFVLKATVMAAALVALSSETARDVVDGPALGWAVAVTVLAWVASLVVSVTAGSRRGPGTAAAGTADSVAPGRFAHTSRSSADAAPPSPAGVSRTPRTRPFQRQRVIDQ